MMPFCAMRNLLAPIVALALFFAAGAPAVAATLQIPPSKYEIAKPGDGGIKYPDYVTSTLGAQPTIWHVPLGLPVNKVITRISYFHLGTSDTPTSVDLWRFKMGQERENLAGGVSYDGTGTIVEEVLTQPGDITIRSGYQYFFTISTNGPSSQVRGIKVTYH
jgi:hypothetical protein